jgi:hypothetical protein
MAELEVAKHGKNVIQLMSRKEHTFAHRLREIVIEVLTIVFAVSMSIWLHGLSEHHHKQQEVEAFLGGLKADLAADVRQLEGTRNSYHGFDANYAYLASLDPARQPDWNTFNDAFAGMNANWFFIPTKSRYDGFQMSGKLTNIEDQKLLTDILDLYQNRLQLIKLSEGGWSNSQHRLRDYVDEQLEGDDQLARWRVITSPKGKRLVTRMKTVDQLYERYQQYIDKSNSIIKQIDTSYPEPASARAVSR